MLHIVLVVLASLGALASESDVALQNADFEIKATRAAPVPGWTLELGAQNGAEKPESVVELDRKTRHGGKASLHFKGKSSTRGWIIAKQEFVVRPGGEYRLSGWSKTEGVAKEGIQFNNCYLALIFEDALGKNAGKQYVWPTVPTSDWSELDLSLVAPAHARTGKVYAFLSMTGDFWLDDLRLTVQGGEALPEFETVFEENFAKRRSLSSKWKKEVGATNGSGGKSSKVEIDDSGAPDSPKSLSLSGDVETRKWYAVRRTFKAEAGELYRFSARVKAEGVKREANQFANFHLHAFFLDRKGESLGTAHFVHPGDGSYDWKTVTVDAIAPLGTEKVRVGVFLSMSGQVWLDDFVLQKQAGGEVPYSDFVELEKDGLTLHYSSHDVNAKHARSYLNRLVRGKAAICRRLEVQWTEPVDIFVYADDATGKSLVGRALDFADPAGRRVHQRWNSFISHELTHVIAHNSLQDSGTGILGEGIAVWLDGRSDEAHHELAAKLLKQGKLPLVADLLSDFGAQENSYPASGSFCGWFLDVWGLKVFKEIYPLGDPSARCEELTGKSFIDMENDWQAELAKY